MTNFTAINDVPEKKKTNKEKSGGVIREFIENVHSLITEINHRSLNNVLINYFST